MKLFYREYGDTGKPLLILHGLFGSSDNWLTQAKFLSVDYHVYLLDQRNHGLSPKGDEHNYEVLAEDIREFIEEYNIPSPILIGHSMGGKAVMKFALNYPELIEKIVIVDIAPKAYPIQHDRILEGLKNIPIESIKSRNEADEILSEYVSERDVRQFLLKNLDRSDQGGFDWKINLSVLDDNINIISEGINESKTCNLPALFINGAKSDYITEKDSPLIKKMFPNHTLVTIDSGHWIHAEKPQEFLKVIQNFIGI